jgi:DNA-binding CsgD family transcriptional regulator
VSEQWSFVKLFQTKMDILSKLPSIANFLARTNRGHASPQVSAAPPRDYRMTRRLTPDELSQVLELYRLGTSTYQLARQFGTDRPTITTHLRQGGVELRPRQKLTPELIEQAKRLYADGQSLAAIGKQLGLTPTAIGTGLKGAGVTLRDTHGRDR